MKFKNQIYIYLMIVCIVLYFIGGKNNQCSKNTGVWVGYESLLPIKIFNKSFLYKDYERLYIKSNLLFTNQNNESSCKIIYDWFEDGLSLNYVTFETKDLVFNKKVDGKYWLNIKDPAARKYIINKIKKYKNKYPNSKIHLDDHWAIPIQYGDYSKELDLLTQEVYNILGPISFSVLPLNYSINHYNNDWLNWISKGYVNDITLQNYTMSNYDLELYIFNQQLIKYNINKNVGIYIRGSHSINDLKYIHKLNKKYNFNTYIFSLRTSLLLDIKTHLELIEKN